MAKARKAPARETRTAAEIVPQFNVGEFLDANGENLKALMRANEAILEGLGALGREMLAFGSTRLRADLATSESLMCCKDASEALQVQMDFVRKASEEYYSEANKLMELANKMAKDCWSPFEDRTEATLQTLSKPQ